MIVVPKSTLSNWMAELARWAPTLKAIKFHGDKEERTALSQRLINTVREEDRDWHVCVTTYEVCNVRNTSTDICCFAYVCRAPSHRLLIPFGPTHRSKRMYWASSPGRT